MKKTTSFLITVLGLGLLTGCQRNSTMPNRAAGTDAATIASGGNQTSDRSGQQPVSPERTGAAPNAQPGAIWNNSTQVGNQPVPNSTRNNQTTPANRNGVNDIPATQPRTDVTNATGGLDAAPARSGMSAANSQKLTEVSRQIDEVDAEMRNNPSETRKTDLNKKRQKLVKQLNKLQGTDKTSTGER
jgi:DNA-binding helix-hairpin-helix protein with protein kinase domain